MKKRKTKPNPPKRIPQKEEMFSLHPMKFTEAVGYLFNPPHGLAGLHSIQNQHKAERTSCLGRACPKP